jgi:plastocyanin
MRKPATAALVLAAGLVAAGCGGYKGSPTTPSANSGTASGGNQSLAPVTITIVGDNGKLSFNPNPATVAAGQTVVFKNTDSIVHHVVLDNGTKQTADIAPGASSAPMTIGTAQSYHCTIHPGMVGGFNGAEGEPPPNCTQGYC